LGASYGDKARAIACYRTQRGALDLWRREARYLGTLYGERRGAEAFWEMPACTYGRIMEHGQWDWSASPFRSLTGRPLSDFAAYLRGSSERRALRAIAKAGNCDATHEISSHE